MRTFKKILMPAYKLSSKFINLDPLVTKIKVALIRRKKKKGPIRIGFIVQMPAIWDKTEIVYNRFSKLQYCETTMVVVPHYDLIAKNTKNDYSNYDFYQKKCHGTIIKAVDDNLNTIDLKDLDFDYVFYERPYDLYLPKQLQTTEVSQFTKICYIPYGYRCSPDFDPVIFSNSIFKNAYYIFCDSKSQISAIKEFHHIKDDDSHNFPAFLNEGYPTLEPYLDLYQNQNNFNTDIIMWTPRFSYNELIGGSHYFEYKDIITDSNVLNNSKLIFRPHPMMFETFISEELMSETDKQLFLDKLEKMGAEYDSDNTLYNSISRSSLLITDISSIIINYFVTGKPIIFCNHKYSKTEQFKKIIDCMYIANNEEDLKRYITEITNGNDYLKEKRHKLINDEFLYHSGSSKRIVNTIINDFNSSYKAKLPKID